MNMDHLKNTPIAKRTVPPTYQAARLPPQSQTRPAPQPQLPTEWTFDAGNSITGLVILFLIGLVVRQHRRYHQLLRSQVNPQEHCRIQGYQDAMKSMQRNQETARAILQAFVATDNTSSEVKRSITASRRGYRTIEESIQDFLAQKTRAMDEGWM